MERITPRSIVVHHRIAWSKTRTEYFIKLVRKHPCLYQPNALNYLDRDIRTKAWEDIHFKIQKMIPEVTITDLKTKLKNLRTQYIKELRALEQAKNSKEEYQPKLWCYHVLGFFQPNPSTYKKHVSSSEDDDDSDLEQNEHDEEYEDDCTDTAQQNSNQRVHLSISKTKAKCDRQTVKSSFDEYIKRIQSLRKAIDKRKRREYKYEWLGKMVASQLEHLDEITQIRAAWDIQCLLQRHLDKVKRTKPTLTDEDEEITVKSELLSDDDKPAFEFIVDNGDTLEQKQENDSMEEDFEIEDDDDN